MHFTNTIAGLKSFEDFKNYYNILFVSPYHAFIGDAMWSVTSI